MQVDRAIEAMPNTDSPRLPVHMIVWNDFCNDARVLNEALTLQQAGYEVVVHAVHVAGKTPLDEIFPSGIRVRRMTLWPWSRYRAVKNFSFGALLLQFFARLGWHVKTCARLVLACPSVIHAHDINTLPTAWLAACLCRAKLIYDAHEISTSREGYRAIRALVACFERRLMPRAHGNITTTENRAKFFARAYLIPRPVVLQNRPRFQRAISSSRIRDELGLKRAWPIVLYQGMQQQGRGLELVLRIVNDVPDAYFVFIGEGRLNDSLRRMSEELGVAERVRFISTVSLADLPNYTASADIGLQPIENTCINHSTTDSNKLFEYVQAGLPVIASALPEIRKVVRIYDFGLLVEPGNSASLTSALNELVSDADRRAYFRGRAIEAARILNWEGQEKLLLNLYDRILR